MSVLFWKLRTSCKHVHISGSGPEARVCGVFTEGSSPDSYCLLQEPLRGRRLDDPSSWEMR